MKIKSLCSIALVMLIILSVFTGCGKKDESGVHEINDVKARNIITPEFTDTKYHTYVEPEAGAQSQINSGLLQLFTDDESCSFFILETSKHMVWSALPCSTEDTIEKNVSDCSVVTIKVCGGTDIYYLNSQDNSVALGKAECRQDGNTIIYSYDMYADAQAAGRELKKDDIAFNVTLKVTLSDGSMNIECEHSNLSGNKNAFIEDIDILNSFGAYSESSDSDFILVPDGCGAIIKTSVNDESFEELTFSVYGNDISADDESDGTAIVPAFGIKYGESAYVALIESGDAISKIKSDKAVNPGEFNRVCSEFNITPVAYKNDTLYCSKSQYSDKIRLCYRFLSGVNATYSGMASACREQLIRNGTLSVSTTAKRSEVPFNLTVIGSVDSDGIPFINPESEITDFSEAQDMLTRLKSKGVNNINLRLLGAFEGGLNSDNAVYADLLKRLGGTKGLNELYDYAATQNMNVFLDVNILSSGKKFVLGSHNAENIFKEYSTADISNPISSLCGEKNYNRFFRSLNKISDIAIKLLSNTRYYSFSGYCFNDVGRVLYSDFSQSGLDRAAACESLRKAIAPLATNKELMTVGGNFYILNGIDTIIDMPLKTNVPQSGAYLSIPFTQMILHGIVDYSGTPFNTSKNFKENLLRCIEYGACPHYLWNYDTLMKDDIDNDIFYCDNSINDAVKLYIEVNSVLEGLSNARITDHYEIMDGVYCTEYDTGTMIYVNYTDEECETLGTCIDAGSYMRIG